MRRDYNGYHSGGSSFVYVNDSWLLQKLFVYHRYKLNSEKKKKKVPVHGFAPKTGSDSPIGSDRDRGRDTIPLICRQSGTDPHLSRLVCCTKVNCLKVIKRR